MGTYQQVIHRCLVDNQGLVGAKTACFQKPLDLLMDGLFLVLLFYLEKKNMSGSLSPRFANDPVPDKWRVF